MHLIIIMIIITGMNLRKTNTVQVLKLLNLLKMVIDCSGLKRLNLRCSAWWTGVGNMSLVKGLNSTNCSSFLLTTQNIQIWKNFSWRKTLRNYQHQIVDICNKRFVWSWDSPIRGVKGKYLASSRHQSMIINQHKSIFHF